TGGPSRTAQTAAPSAPASVPTDTGPIGVWSTAHLTRSIVPDRGPGRTARGRRGRHRRWQPGGSVRRAAGEGAAGESAASEMLPGVVLPVVAGRSGGPEWRGWGWTVPAGGAWGTAALPGPQRGRERHYCGVPRPHGPCPLQPAREVQCAMSLP